jgi:hypothetical protein
MLSLNSNKLSFIADLLSCADVMLSKGLIHFDYFIYLHYLGESLALLAQVFGYGQVSPYAPQFHLYHSILLDNSSHLAVSLLI